MTKTTSFRFRKDNSNDQALANLLLDNEREKAGYSTPKLQVPQRWQRSMARGAKQPLDTVYCGRPSLCQNDYVIGTPSHDNPPIPLSREDAVELFRTVQMPELLADEPDHYDFLLGADYLSCWCGLDEKCHVDIIIEHLSRRIKELEGVNNG